MNMCVLILGTWFLQLNNGYNDVDFVKIESIVAVRANDNYPTIYTLDHEIRRTGWIPKQNRYMTSTETMDLIKTCTE